MDIAVLFDLEDTLVQTPWSNHKHVLEFRRNTRQKLVDLGIPPTILEGIEHATIMRNEASEYVEEYFSHAKAERFHQKMEKFLNHYEQDSAKKSSLFPDTIPVLKTLDELGVKIGLVTNTSRKAVDVILEIHGLTGYFDVIVTREDVRRLKPDPEGILYAIKRLGVKHFFMIGDLVLDVLATKSSGGVAVIVRRNLELSDSQDLLKSLPADALKKVKRSFENGSLQADYTIQSLAEVPAIIQSGKRDT